MIKLFDVPEIIKEDRNEILKSWKKILENGDFTSGNETNTLEKKFASFNSCQYALGVNSGTASLIISLLAAGIKANDEVITTPLTFSATVDAIIHCQAKPVFVDIDPLTGNIDPDLIEKKITARTKAILPVHLYGIACEMTKIKKICSKHHLLLIEDCSHAHGTLYRQKNVGTFGIAGCFSLYPSKTLGAAGNAGIIISNNLSFINLAKAYANHGITDQNFRYQHHFSGYNELIDNLQAAFLLIRLKKLSSIINHKLELAQKYNQVFRQFGLTGMSWTDDIKPSIYAYSFQATKREKILNYCQQNQIEAKIYYPIPMHLQPSMKWLKYQKRDLPKAEKFSQQTISIPLTKEILHHHLEKIIQLAK